MDFFYRVLYNNGHGWHVHLNMDYDKETAYKIARLLLEENPYWHVRIFKLTQIFDSQYDKIPPDNN